MHGRATGRRDAGASGGNLYVLLRVNAGRAFSQSITESESRLSVLRFAHALHMRTQHVGDCRLVFAARPTDSIP